MPPARRGWTDEDITILLKMWPSESIEAIRARFPDYSWDRLKKVASQNGVRRSLLLSRPESFISGAVSEFLTEQREWDAGGFSAAEGWRDRGLIAAAVAREEAKVDAACRALEATRRIEATEGESGWVFYRAVA